MKTLNLQFLEFIDKKMTFMAELSDNTLKLVGSAVEQMNRNKEYIDKQLAALNTRQDELERRYMRQQLKQVKAKKMKSRKRRS